MIVYLLICCIVVIFVELETEGRIPFVEMTALSLLWPVLLFVTLAALLCAMIGRME